MSVRMSAMICRKLDTPPVCYHIWWHPRRILSQLRGKTWGEEGKLFLTLIFQSFLVLENVSTILEKNTVFSLIWSFFDRIHNKFNLHYWNVRSGQNSPDPAKKDQIRIRNPTVSKTKNERVNFLKIEDTFTLELKPRKLTDLSQVKRLFFSIMKLV